jgi:hypothetical protein
VGQQDVYEEASECLRELLGIEVSHTQIERVCECYGKLLDTEVHEVKPVDPISVEEDEVLYAMADGSMILIREEGWKEIKLGRLFKGSSHEAISEKRFRISESVYSAHVGGYKEFVAKWQKEIPNHANLVLLADGVPWFWDWAKESYPQALQILDYYHCKEYLCEFAQKYFKKEKDREKWIEQQEERFFQDKVDEVIEDIKALPIKALEHNAIKKIILTYYENNRSRMLYGSYRKQGLLIGSGPIEAAHRNVIQKRLKLAGQRWNKKGAQWIANLRTCRKSKRWNKIIELSNSEKLAA